MNLGSVLMAAALLPAVGLMAWVWFGITQVMDELRAFTGIDARHFGL